MGSVQTMMGAGISGSGAKAIGIGTVATGLTAAGSDNTDAFQMVADANLFSTVASGTGALLPNAEAGSEVTVINGGAETLTVYPPSGGQVNNQTATTAGISVGSGKAGIFKRLDNIHWAGVADAA